MLARKFLHYQQDRPKITGEETEEELSGPAPRSLYLLAACMIKVSFGRLHAAFGSRCTAKIVHPRPCHAVRVLVGFLVGYVRRSTW